MDSEANMHSIVERMLIDENENARFMPISFLRSITNDFSKDQIIGKGGFGAVYKGVLDNGRTIAVKRLKGSQPTMGNDRCKTEVDCMRRTKHKNIVRFLGYCVAEQKSRKFKGKKDSCILCFEYLHNGSVRNYITGDSEQMSWTERYKIIKGICEGLHYLHLNGILHLDLKSASILLDESMVPKICDFGTSRFTNEKPEISGTMGYMAPESLGRNEYKSDIYSLGVVITEILTGHEEYPSVDDVMKMWSARFGTSTADALALLHQVRVCTGISLECLKSDPSKRPDTQRIITMLDQHTCDECHDILVFGILYT